MGRQVLCLSPVSEGADCLASWPDIWRAVEIDNPTTSHLCLSCSLPLSGQRVSEQAAGDTSCSNFFNKCEPVPQERKKKRLTHALGLKVRLVPIALLAFGSVRIYVPSFGLFDFFSAKSQKQALHLLELPSQQYTLSLNQIFENRNLFGLS